MHAERPRGSRKCQVWLLPLLGAIFVVTHLTGPGARLSLWVLVAAPIATALLLTLAIFILRRAEGKPALQTLAATIMVLCTAVAIAIYHCTAWCSVLACLPAGLAGKQAFSACWPCVAHGPDCPAYWLCFLGLPPHTSCRLILRCRAGGACVFSKLPKTPVVLAKAATSATIVYCTIVANLCMLCEVYAAPYCAIYMFLAAAVGSAVGDSACRFASRVLLARGMYENVRAAGVFSGKILGPASGSWVLAMRRSICNVCTGFARGIAHLICCNHNCTTKHPQPACCCPTAGTGCLTSSYVLQVGKADVVQAQIAGLAREE